MHSKVWIVRPATPDRLRPPTYDALGEGGPHERGQPQVSYLDGACGARDEDVVTLEVAVHYGRGARVQELQPLQDLPTPAAQHLGLHHLEALQVAV